MQADCEVLHFKYSQAKDAAGAAQSKVQQLEAQMAWMRVCPPPSPASLTSSHRALPSHACAAAAIRSAGALGRVPMHGRVP